jgi:hypothetical protein
MCRLEKITTLYILIKVVPYLLFVQVISSMKILMTEDSNNDHSNSFLLDDNSRFTYKQF